MKTYSKNSKIRKPDGMEKKKKPKKPMGMKEGGEVPFPRRRPDDLQAGAPSRKDNKEPAEAKLQRQIRDLQTGTGYGEKRARTIIMGENDGKPLSDKDFNILLDFYKEREGKMYGGMTKKKMAKGGKLKMVEKDGKKVPFYAADGKGKM